jgi:hypothetical protein
MLVKVKIALTLIAKKLLVWELGLQKRFWKNNISLFLSQKSLAPKLTKWRPFKP